MGNEVAKTLEMTAYLDRLSSIVRYPMWDKLRPINVSEHSFRVAMLCMMIADMKPETSRLDFAILMRKALLHDFGEVLMGDISYPVKHKNDETEKFFEKLEASCVDEMFEHNPFYRNYAKHGKDGPEGKIVAVADMFDNVLYSAREVMMGNNTMLILLKRCVDFIMHDTIDTPFDFIGFAAKALYREVQGYTGLDVTTTDRLEARYGVRP